MLHNKRWQPMRSNSLTTCTNYPLVMVMTVILLGGCAQTKDFFTGMTSSETAAGDPGILGAPEIDVYLSELQLLASGDPASQAEIFADSQSGAQLTPGPQTSLRYALVLATPGHPETDARQAASMLREVLAAPQLLTDAEIALASIYLRQADELANLEAEVARLRAAASRAAQSRESASAQRIATLDADNRRLRQELAEAEEKLEAITSIERSIREQE
jgi:hypothetical protein